MHTYFQLVPAAAAKREVDGHLYARVASEMYSRPDGQQHARDCKRERMLRVSHIKDGVAYVPLGKAGDAIACLTNLPFGIVTQHEADAPAILH